MRAKAVDERIAQDRGHPRMAKAARGSDVAVVMRRAVAASPCLAPADALVLQRAVGNRATTALLVPGDLVIQRDVDSAAAALHKQGIKTVKKGDVKGKFAKDHGVSVGDVGAIQGKLDTLRQAGAAQDARDAALKKLKVLRDGSSGVTITQSGVEVHLDNDQLKHQHPDHPIGTRTVSGGNLFTTVATTAWHEANTLVHMADWAAGLAGMAEGDKREHGQARPVNDIHYEGFCLMAGGQKYVAFHCYPANGSALKADFKK